MSVLSARELQQGDIELIADYWSQSDPKYLVGMGVDLKLLPPRESLVRMLSGQVALPVKERQSYCTIWEIDGSPVGHCNVNKITFGDQAFMHLHLWDTKLRSHGLGATLVRRSLPCFFDRLELRDVYCEPYALNAAPNRALAKVGFEFIKEYTTVPGFMNFEQPVKRWLMTRARHQTLDSTARSI
jgi:RimJ/RimL family protein N-acetyltransferase